MASKPAAGGGRWVEVPPARLERWIAGFAERHGGMSIDGLCLHGDDGDTAEFHLTLGQASTVEELLVEALKPHRFGLILARRGGFAVGVVDGDQLIASKVDSGYVQGRTAAGGWSQQRFARRRDNQAKKVWATAADTVVRVLLPHMPVDGLVCGGDRQSVDAILADQRLSVLAHIRSERFLDVAEPRKAVLEHAVEQARAVRVLLKP